MKLIGQIFLFVVIHAVAFTFAVVVLGEVINAIPQINITIVSK